MLSSLPFTSTSPIPHHVIEMRAGGGGNSTSATVRDSEWLLDDTAGLEAQDGISVGHDFNHHIRVPPLMQVTKQYCCCTPTCQRRFVMLCWISALIWTLSTFILLTEMKVCWTARDELEMLNKFNAVSFLEGEGPWPLRNAHSHNDYVNPKPLGEALSAGFCSVEGDVHLRNGALWLGHELPGDTTLTDIYLKPLVRLAGKFGTVFKRSVHLNTCLQVTILVDVKTADAVEVYRVLEDQLDIASGGVLLPDGRPFFDTFDSATGLRVDTPTSALPPPLRVILTGVGGALNELADAMLSRPTYRVKLDVGQLPAAGSKIAKVAGWLSVKWSDPLNLDTPWHWPPSDALDANNTAKALRDSAKGARAMGLMTRFWNTPENPALWDLLLTSGIDLINTDLIFTLHSFLAGKGVNMLD